MIKSEINKKKGLEYTQGLIDISPTISETSPVFPGDTKFTRRTNLTFSKGDSIELSSIESTLHIGSHTDAPSHYHTDGVSIDKRDLKFYLGEAQVIDLSNNCPLLIDTADLRTTIRCPRVLIKTNSFDHQDKWSNEFCSLSANLINDLHQAGVITIGIDTPSVDPAISKTLDAHQQIYASDMAILEGLDLRQVDAGIYTLISLPLKISQGDASPVRAVLIPHKRLSQHQQK